MSGFESMIRATIAMPSVQTQMREQGYVQSPASIVGDFHVELAKAQVPGFARRIKPKGK